MKALIPLADGVEEMEAVIVIDTLRRAGWDVTAAGIAGTTIRASRGVGLLADVAWADMDANSFEILILPGGLEGTRALCAHDGVQQAIRTFADTGRPLAAICAAPLALQAAGVLKGRHVTCHPTTEKELTQATLVGGQRVVVDGNLVTSRGPGTALEFALTLIREFDDTTKADAIAKAMVI